MVTEAKAEEAKKETEQEKTERRVRDALTSLWQVVKSVTDDTLRTTLTERFFFVGSYVDQSFDLISRLSQRAAAADRRIVQLERELASARHGIAVVPVTDRELPTAQSLEAMRQALADREDFLRAYAEVCVYIAALECQSSSLETSCNVLRIDNASLRKRLEDAQLDAVHAEHAANVAGHYAGELP